MDGTNAQPPSTRTYWILKMTLIANYIRTSPTHLKTYGPRAGVHAEVYEGPTAGVLLVRVMDARGGEPAILRKDAFIAKSIEPDGSESLCLGQVTNYAYRPSDVVKNDKVFQLVTFERFDRLVAAAAQC